jgi:class 3 adenylate cyclase/tetratricopeptide (TPR) repeat protein
MAACPSCGEANPARARFCLACGKPLPAAAAAPAETRKTVTVVFCDVVDSTPLGEQLDAETYRRVISRYFIEASRVFERHGGTVEKFIGDAVMAVFGIPVVHEDDALRAVRAAAELREALARLNAELHGRLGIELGVRVGVDTGEVFAGDASEGQAFATGEAVVVAQRLEAAASSGEILIGEATHRLVRDAVLVEPVRLELKGLGAREAWRLLGVVAGAPAFARRLDRPLVGRERELSLLEHAYRRAVDERSCHLFTVFGAAGVGKSRLVNEFVTRLGDQAHVLTGRCVPYGEGMTFWPLREMIRQAAGVASKTPPDEARRRLAEMLEADPDAEAVAETLTAVTGIAEGESTTEETLWALRKFVERRAVERPHALVFDDVQWAEPAFLDLIDQLAEWTRDAPVLIVCLARPDLLEEHPVWGGGKVNASAIQLEPLRGEQLERLIENLLEGSEVPAAALETLRTAGEGNPLFVEEMLAMLAEQRFEGPVETPPTIQALLAARIDRLDEGQRDVLGRASVIGKTFSREALGALVSPEQIEVCLPPLDRKDLIRRDQAAPPGDEVYGFRHILIRDAAYNGLPKEQRAELHERLADWIAAARPEREFEEVLGFHLEQAHRYRSELSEETDDLRGLAARAAGHLAAAGRRAIGRGDIAAAVSLLTRATILLRDDEAARLELAPDLGSALREAGELARAEGVLSRAVDAASARGDSRLEHTARLEHAAVRVRIDPQLGIAELRRTAERAIECFEELGDDIGLARAWLRLSDVHWISSQWGLRTEALERALVHARAAGSKRHERWILGTLATSIYFGPMPMSEAIRRYEDLLADAEGAPVLDARLRSLLGLAKAAIGEFEDGRAEYRRSRAALEEQGHRLLAALGTLAGGWIETLAGDLEAAEAELRRGCDELRGVGETASFSTVAAFLARTLYLRGNYAEAEEFVEASASAGRAEDLTTQVILRGTEAKLLARGGSIPEAERVAREAVSLAGRTDELALQGMAHLDLAEVLRLSGREQEAASTASDAADLFARKEHLVERRNAEAWLAAGARA